MQTSSITFVERKPSAPLAWAVKALWALEGHLVGEAAAIPKPFVELVISLEDGHLWRATKSRELFKEGWITPLQTGPRYSMAQGVTSFVGARLEPNAAIRLLGPLALGDGDAPFKAESIIGAEFRRLRDRIGEAAGFSARISVLEAWLADRFARLPESRFTSQMVPSANWRVDTLCSNGGLADREGRRTFHAALGCSPKFWLRLHRLSAVIADPLFQKSAEPLADTAARFGLTDQAHLAREFRLLAGMPPSAYQQRRQYAGLQVAPSMAPASAAFYKPPRNLSL